MNYQYISNAITGIKKNTRNKLFVSIAILEKYKKLKFLIEFNCQMIHQMKKKLLLLVILIVSFKGFGQIDSKHYSLAIECFDQNNFALASLYLDSIIEANPKADSCISLRAFCFYNIGSLELARKDCEKAIEINKYNELAYYTQALVKSSQAMDEQSARAILDQLDGENPKQIEEFSKRYKFGSTYLEQTLYDYGSAIEDLKKTISIDPYLLDAYLLRAQLYQELNEYDKALLDLNVAIELEPNEGYNWFERALIHSDLENYSEALKDFNEAIRLTPDEAIFYSNRGHLKRFQLDDKDGACSDYKRSISLGFYLGEYNEYCK